MSKTRILRSSLRPIEFLRRISNETAPGSLPHNRSTYDLRLTTYDLRLTTYDSQLTTHDSPHRQRHQRPGRLNPSPLGEAFKRWRPSGSQAPIRGLAPTPGFTPQGPIVVNPSLCRPPCRFRLCRPALVLPSVSESLQAAHLPPRRHGCEYRAGGTESRCRLRPVS